MSEEEDFGIVVRRALEAQQKHQVQAEAYLKTITESLQEIQAELKRKNEWPVAGHQQVVAGVSAADTVAEEQTEQTETESAEQTFSWWEVLRGFWYAIVLGGLIGTLMFLSGELAVGIGDKPIDWLDAAVFWVAVLLLSLAALLGLPCLIGRKIPEEGWEMLKAGAWMILVLLAFLFGPLLLRALL